MLIHRNTRKQIIEDRDRALRLVGEALDKLAEANAAYRRAGMDTFSLFAGLTDTDWILVGMQRDGGRLVEKIRKRLDARIWEHLLEVSGMRSMMDAKAIEEYRDQLENPPEVNEENLIATFRSLIEDRQRIFRRGLVNVFRGLSSEYARHDAFRISPRIILKGVLSEYGWCVWGQGQEKVHDLDRIFHLLDDQPEPDPHYSAAQAIYAARREGRDEVQTPYFQFRLYRNGNIHIRFLRNDLLELANRLVAEYYKQSLPDDRKGRRSGRRTAA